MKLKFSHNRNSKADDTQHDDRQTHPQHRHPLRAPRRYRLSFVNESTLNNIWTLGMSRKRLILYIAGIILAILLLGASFIAFTPLRNLLPGYLQPAERSRYLHDSQRLDSILDRANATGAYLNNIVAIFDDDINVDSIWLLPPPPAITSNVDSLIATTSDEEAYVQQYLSTHKFSLDTDITGDDGLPVFQAPVEGAIVSRGSSPAATRIKLNQPRAQVSAIASGNVVATSTDAKGRHSAVVQHNDGYVTTYGSLDKLYLATGSKVSPGTRIGLINEKNPTRDAIQFALWRNGTRLDPLDYIPF